MSKIIQAVNAMVSNPQKISRAIRALDRTSQELYFLYDGKHKWSIIRGDANQAYYLHYYPGSNSIETLASTTRIWPETIDSVTYSTESLKSREAFESFEALYGAVQEKLWGINKILDDIIKNDDYQP